MGGFASLMPRFDPQGAYNSSVNANIALQEEGRREQLAPAQKQTAEGQANLINQQAQDAEMRNQQEQMQLQSQAALREAFERASQRYQQQGQQPAPQQTPPPQQPQPQAPDQGNPYTPVPAGTNPYGMSPYHQQPIQAQQAMQSPQPQQTPQAQQPQQAPHQPMSFNDVLMDELSKNALTAQHIPAIQEAQMKQQEMRLGLASKQMGMLASLAGSVRDEPTKIAALTSAASSGLISPDQARAYAQVPFSQLQPQLTSWQQQALTAQQQIDDTQKNATHQLAVDKFNQEVQQNAPKTADEWLKTAAPILESVHDQATLDSARNQVTGAIQDPKMRSSVLSLLPQQYTPESGQALQGLGISAKEQPELQEGEQRVWAMRLSSATSKEDYAAKFARVPAGLSPYFVQPEDWTPKAGETNMKVGANPIAVIQAENTAEWRKLSAQQRQQRIDQMGQALRDRENKGEGGLTPAQQATDRRAAESEYQKLALREATLNRQRVQLGQLMKSGQPVTEKNGDPRDVSGEFEAASDELARVLTDKYETATRAGRGAPRVPLSEALTAIGRGTQPDASPRPNQPQQQPAQRPAQQPQPRPQPASNQQAAKISEADARQRAIQAGKDPDWYVNELKKRGLLQ